MLKITRIRYNIIMLITMQCMPGAKTFVVTVKQPVMVNFTNKNNAVAEVCKLFVNIQTGYWFFFPLKN